jgi:transposase
LVWWKRIWRCPNRGCGTDVDRAVPAGRAAAVADRAAKAWVTGRVGADGETVSSVARSLGVGWWSVMRAVAEVGHPLVDDPGRLADVAGLGVDEHAWPCASTCPTPPTSWTRSTSPHSG